MGPSVEAGDGAGCEAPVLSRSPKFVDGDGGQPGHQRAEGKGPERVIRGASGPARERGARCVAYSHQGVRAALNLPQGEHYSQPLRIFGRDPTRRNGTRAALEDAGRWMPEDEPSADRGVGTGPIRTEVQGHVGRDLVEVPREVNGGRVDGGVRKGVEGDAQRLQALLQGDGFAHRVLEPREGEGGVLDEGVARRRGLGVRQRQPDGVAQAQERGADATRFSCTVHEVGRCPLGGAEGPAVRTVDARLQRRQVNRTEEYPGENEVDGRGGKRVKGPEA